MLTQQFFQLGLVAKRLKKEIFAHLVMILVRNQVWSDPSSQDVIQVSDKSCKVQKRAQNFQGVNLSISQEGFSFMLIFTISEFLKLLYSKNKNKKVDQIANKILQAMMTFTHFASTSEQLSTNFFPNLYHNLLC